MRVTSLFSALFILGLLAGCNSPEEKESNYVRRGNELFDEGEYEKARIEYKNAARLKPADAEVRYRLGLVEEAEGNLSFAFADFTHAVEQDAHYNPARVKIAEYFIAAGENEEGRNRLDAIIADTPNFADAYAMHAALDLRAKNYHQAEEEARTALEKDPQDIIAFSVLGSLYNAQGDLAKAVAIVDDGIARNPRELSLLLLKASFYEQAKDYARVADIYQAIFKLRPKEKRYRIELAAIYLKAGEPDQAEAALRDGIAAMPDDWDMKKQLVIFLADKRGVDVAEKQIRDYMKTFPHKEDLIFWLADVYLTHNAADRAVDLLQQIAARSETDHQSLNARALLARMALARGDTAKAQELTAFVLARDASNDTALYVHASLASINGQYDNAISDLRTIIRDNPQKREAYPLLADALAHQGHLDLAADTLKQLTEIDPLNLEAQVQLAEIEAENNNAKQALALLTALAKSNPTYAPAWEAAARISIASKDWLAARGALDALDALDGQHLKALYLRGNMLGQNNQAEEAIAQYRQVAAADPAAPLAGAALADMVAEYKSLNRLDDAIHYLTDLKTDTFVINTLLGECYLDEGKTALAAASFDKAIYETSHMPETYLLRAKIYLDAKEPDQAITTLKKAVIVAPGDIRAPLMQAEIFSSEGKYAEAIALYDDVLARDPSLDAVANNLAETIADYEYNDAAALDKARKTAERFTGSTNPLLLDTLAWVYFRQNDTEEAQTIMERALAGDTRVPPQMHYHYGLILYKSGKMGAAKEQLQKAVVAGADYPGLDDARKILTQLSGTP